MVEGREAKSAKRSFASKIKIGDILTRIFASRFQLRFAHPFLAKLKRTTNWSLYPQGLIVFSARMVLLQRFQKSSWIGSRMKLAPRVATLAPFWRMSCGVVSSLGTLISKSRSRALADSPAAHTLVPFLLLLSFFKPKIINQNQNQICCCFFSESFIEEIFWKEKKEEKRKKKSRILRF